MRMKTQKLSTREKQNTQQKTIMTSKLQFIISASAALVVSFPTLAEDVSNPNQDGFGHARDRMHLAGRADRLNGAAKASDLIGMKVKNYQDEKLGEVEDLAVDVESGRLVQVILSTGGVSRPG